MSQIKHNYPLPAGSPLEWDMSQLTDEQLKREHELSYACLHGIYLKGNLIIKGLLDPKYSSLSGIIDTAYLQKAREVWTQRLKRAETELERRFLSS